MIGFMKRRLAGLGATALLLGMLVGFAPAAFAEETVRLGSSQITNYGKQSQNDAQWATPAMRGEAFKYLVVGRDFRLYKVPRPTTPGRLEVIYFFWYGSDWSAKIDAQARSWGASQSASIRFQPSPMVLSNKWALGARVFFALEQLKVEHRVGPLLQQAVARQEVSLENPRQVRDFVVASGVNRKKFEAAINDPRVISKAFSTQPAARMYGLQIAPTFVIDGKFVFQASPNTSPENLLKMVQFFVKNYQEDQAKGK